MKKILIFIGGFVAGIIATILVLFLISKVMNTPNDDGVVGLTIFPEKGECITTEYETTDYDLNKGRITTVVVNEIKVFQVLAPNMALATTGEYGGIVVLLLNYDGKTYYDNQKIVIPANQCARQIGTYRYTTRQDKFEKTVPAVVIEQK